MLTKDQLYGKINKRQLVFSGKTMSVDYTCALCLSIVNPLEGCMHCGNKLSRLQEQAQTFFMAKKQENLLLKEGLPIRKRGRPRIHPIPDKALPKRPRGRPKGSKNKKGGKSWKG